MTHGRIIRKLVFWPLDLISNLTVVNLIRWLLYDNIGFRCTIPVSSTIRKWLKNTPRVVLSVVREIGQSKLFRGKPSLVVLSTKSDFSEAECFMLIAFFDYSSHQIMHFFKKIH